ncbi:site-specific DNA-methyltransferase [Ensifer sp. BR816]|uniref:site-specific DNA-methyltransferase n=1 Tax=Rhizobium sp. (strain BR816) TaxID=1057002 RepID=UPI000378F03A|nr:site-specific DNA-methyltransferase [Ensifer sp. BR816]
MVQDNFSGASIYKHKQDSVQRPDVGVEAQFSTKKAPKSYRYDSSLAPELSWDESADRAFAEWLLTLVAEAAEKDEAAVFAEPQIWQGTQERFTSLPQCAARLRSLTKPFLNWTGKAERQQVTVPTLPLFVHERHSTQAILETLKSHKALGTNLDLFGDINLDVADKLDAYEHKGPWTNRLILGDSLQVMNSLLEYEGMGGQVQMIYFDPPYGVKFGSNFQPFVRDRKVSTNHGNDEYMIREPEMVKAYRDTWELGLHSYLTYLRDRLHLARELLSDTGSIFVQISDETYTELRSVVEEVFGKENYLVTIVFKKKSATQVTHAVNDYIIWCAKDKAKFAPKQIYYKRPNPEDNSKFNTLISSDGKAKKVKDLSQDDIDELTSSGWRWARANYPIVSQHYSKTRTKPYIFQGKEKTCGANNQWRFDVPEGLDRLARAGRLHDGGGQSLGGISFWDDWPYVSYNNVWTDVHGEQRPSYVVQTSAKVIERCMLMATDPGDLVLDITCGSGTTATVAEQWGRRWITTDTSRVPIALARQRLLTGIFPWYRLKEPARGPAGGFAYERKQNNKGEEIGGLAPRITLKSIANNEEPGIVTLVDRPEVNNKITRVCGPFTVEATIQAAMSLDEDAPQEAMQQRPSSPRAYLDRMIEVLRQSKTLRLPGNVTLELETVSPLADREYLHAKGLAQNGVENRIAFAFGPEDGAIGSEYVFNAHTEALQQGYQQLFLFGFAIQAKAREMLDKLKIPTVYVSVTPDVVMSDLLKTSKASEIFSITGLPDVELQAAGKRDDGTPLHRVVIKGLDIFRPDTMETDEIKAENLPCWMLDTNYNGMAFLASQVFFPKTSAWDNLQKSLKGQFADSVWEHLAGTVSEPFLLGDKKRIAVKAIDERGNELMVVKSAEVVR